MNRLLEKVRHLKKYHPRDLTWFSFQHGVAYVLYSMDATLIRLIMSNTYDLLTKPSTATVQLDQVKPPTIPGTLT
jgi:hypothetical protein